jgi:hypothetical protein
MCQLNREDFMNKTPSYVGDILYEHLQMLKQHGEQQLQLRAQDLTTGVEDNEAPRFAERDRLSLEAGFHFSSTSYPQQLQQPHHHPHHFYSPPTNYFGSGLPFDRSAAAAAAAAADARLFGPPMHYLQHPVSSKLFVCGRVRASANCGYLLNDFIYVSLCLPPPPRILINR